MSRVPVAVLICGGGAIFFAGSWFGHWVLMAAGIALTGCGFALGLLMRAREHGGYVRGAAAFAEEYDRGLPSGGTGVEAERIRPRTVWLWTVWAVLTAVAVTGMFATGADVRAGGWATAFGIAAIVLLVGMGLERLARTWGSWWRVLLWLAAMPAVILLLIPLGEWPAGLGFFAVLMYGAWSWPGIHGWKPRRRRARKSRSGRRARRRRARGSA